MKAILKDNSEKYFFKIFQTYLPVGRLKIKNDKLKMIGLNLNNFVLKTPNSYGFQTVFVRGFNLVIKLPSVVNNFKQGFIKTII